MASVALTCLTTPNVLHLPSKIRSDSSPQLSAADAYCRLQLCSSTYRSRDWRCKLSTEQEPPSNGDPSGDFENPKPESSKADANVIVPDKGIKRRIALASVLGAVGLFVATRGWFGGGVTLGDLNASAVPYDQALKNGLPTVVEFYADWCEVCRELAPEVYKVEQEFKDKVNFVMLNVDNSKWEEEIDEFGVEGIPHFAFLDREGNEEGNIVGRVPKQYLSENLASLVRGDKTIPHSKFVGQSSNAETRQVHAVANPRGHNSP